MDRNRRDHADAGDVEHLAGHGSAKVAVAAFLTDRDKATVF
jgi:hypothetical protein